MANPALDLDAHNGLRGAASVWVVLFHCLLFNTSPTDWQGSSVMPLFFLLSGFSLMVVYGASPDVYRYNPDFSTSAAVRRLPGAAGQKSEGSIRWYPFMVNRLARVMPMYYAGNLLALPLQFAGFGAFPQNVPLLISLSCAVSFLPVAVVASPGMGIGYFPLDGPSWTVQTLLWMWMAFPRFLSGVKLLSDEQLVSRIFYYFVLQQIFTIVLFYVLVPFLGFWAAFATATWQPLFRFPVFLMGLYAGALCLRYPDPQQPMPWSLGPCLGRCRRTKGDEVQGKEAWASVADFHSGYLLFFTLAVGVADTVLRYCFDYSSLLGGVWYQAIIPGTQLTVLVALTRDGGQSMASRALRTGIAQWLGKISMSLYLVHIPLFGYLAWALYGGANVPPDLPCPGSAGDPANKACNAALGQWTARQAVPMWSIAVLLPAAILVAWACFHLIEEPARKALRYREGKQGSSEHTAQLVPQWGEIESGTGESEEARLVSGRE